MKLTTAKKIIDKLKDRNIECSLRENYSGRAMFGSTTAAVIIKNTFDRREAQSAAWSLTKMRVDNMGLGIIFY